ncbi:MAG: hypothetical protein CMM60_12860 [Rhodospirillaceae bacterium]|nr:hypothetical protein [Rhodospirillaceae bacterium]
MKDFFPMSPSDGLNNAPGAKKSSPARLLVLALMVLAVGAVFVFGLDDFLSFEMVKTHRQTAMDWYAQNKILTVLVFIIGYAVTVALSVPGAVWLSLAAGFLFGTVPAMVYVVVAATLGALGIFLIARYVLFDFFHEKMGETGKKMENGFQDNALSYLLVLRLIPIFPFWLVNLVPALLGVPARTFVIGTFLGIIPGAAVFCSIGSGLGAIIDKGEMPDPNIIFQPQFFGPLLGLGVLALLPVAYKRLKASRSGTG